VAARKSRHGAPADYRAACAGRNDGAESPKLSLPDAEFSDITG
jgi:hypothetical protein